MIWSNEQTSRLETQLVMIELRRERISSSWQSTVPQESSLISFSLRKALILNSFPPLFALPLQEYMTNAIFEFIGSSCDSLYFLFEFSFSMLLKSKLSSLHPIPKLAINGSIVLVWVKNTLSLVEFALLLSKLNFYYLIGR